MGVSLAFSSKKVGYGLRFVPLWRGILLEEARLPQTGTIEDGDG
jgi:hypothetical protein